MLKVIYFQITVFYTHKIQFTAQKNSVFIISQPGRAGQGLAALGDIQALLFYIEQQPWFSVYEMQRFSCKIN